MFPNIAEKEWLCSKSHDGRNWLLPGFYKCSSLMLILVSVISFGGDNHAKPSRL